MIEVANLLDLDREIGRRSFLRRIFAMGAGIAASGALVRAIEAIPQPYGVSPMEGLNDLNAKLRRAYVGTFDSRTDDEDVYQFLMGGFRGPGKSVTIRHAMEPHPNERRAFGALIG